MAKKQNKQVHDYILNKINVFIEPLVYNIVLNRPSNPVTYAINWLTEYARKKCISGRFIDSDTDQECQDEVKQLQNIIAKKKQARKHHTSRMGISQQVFGQFNNREQITLRENTQITQKQMLLVKQLMRGSILFQNLDARDQQVILKEISRKQTYEDELIIKQNQAGDSLYIVQSGQYDCYKLVNDQNVLVKTYYSGEVFGELSLMYNAPRAATIIVKKAGQLLTLGRSTFSHILKVAALRKQQLIKNAIQKVDILKSIPLDQRHQFINILKEEKYQVGQYILKEGDEGDAFYIVLEGTLVAEKCEDNQQIKEVYKYQEGDYFGQLSLINNEPRRASIKATTLVKLAKISRIGFSRVFGAIQQTFKQKSHKYVS